MSGAAGGLDVPTPGVVAGDVPEMTLTVPPPSMFVTGGGRTMVTAPALPTIGGAGGVGRSGLLESTGDGGSLGITATAGVGSSSIFLLQPAASATQSAAAMTKGRAGKTCRGT